MKAEMTTSVVAQSRARRSFRWMRYLLMGILSLVIALVFAGAVYERIESHRDRRLFRPPGRLVDIGGYRLQLYCLGEGSPTVILEAGGGNPWLSWYKVQPRVASFTRFVRTTARDSDGAILARGRERQK